jgi:phosphoribosylamine--glycine ligase
MRVLIIGSGGRENAIAWKISKSPLLEKLFCAPGNPGTSSIAVNLNIDIKSFDAVKCAVLENSVDMIVVGPEEPLVNGLGDFFKNDESLKEIIFIGPGSEGAKLEGSKEFAKNFMSKYRIPTAGYKSFNIDSFKDAEQYIDSLKAPYVLKADGLAAGKGVLIIDDSRQAKRELKEMLTGRFGSAGDKVVIEEFLSGIELSVFVLTDGKNYLILPEAKDYKRACDGDQGLNTGGMGAVSPVPFADAGFMRKVESRIIVPTIAGLQNEGIEYKGFIFIGLMNCSGDPYVIEYNVRMGDPESEAVIPRIESDLLSHLIALGEGRLDRERIEISDKFAITLVMVSGGYPQSFEKGFEISGASELSGEMLFHSGTTIKEGKLVTSGGRVLALTALADGIQSGREKLYSLARKVSYKGIFYRGDIGLDLITH